MRHVALVALLLAGACAAPPERTLTAGPAPLRAVCIRLLPGQDPKAELDKLAKEKGIEAGCVLSCAGSLARASVRFANRPEATVIEDKLEIVSLSGTVSSR